MNFTERMEYAYIKRLKRWMECPVCHKRMTFSKEQASWVCKSCKYAITEEEFLDDFVFWFCDGCNAYLNIQPGFDRKGTSWICTNCGFDNDTTFINLRGMCKDCDTLLMDADATICPDCKRKRMEKAKVALEAAAGLCFTLSAALSVEKEQRSGGTFEYDMNDEQEETRMKCATCGNTDEETLWDEGDTIYCSLCHHRTSLATGKDDVVECPYCHRMRDRKAAYCRHCNDSMWQPSTPEEFAEIDRSLKEIGH